MSLQVKIPKLTGTDNFKSWARSVRAFLEMRGLWSVVENGPTNNEQNDLRAKNLIFCLIEESIFEDIEDADSAKIIWEKLCNLYDPQRPLPDRPRGPEYEY